ATSGCLALQPVCHASDTSVGRGESSEGEETLLAPRADRRLHFQPSTQRGGAPHGPEEGPPRPAGPPLRRVGSPPPRGLLGSSAHVVAVRAGGAGRSS